MTTRVAAICEIADDARQNLTDYPATGEAQIADTMFDGERLIVRRMRPLDGDEQPFKTWQHHALITSRDDDAAWSKPSTARTPASSSRSATSKTRRRPTSRPGGSPPTPPGR